MSGAAGADWGWRSLLSFYLLYLMLPDLEAIGDVWSTWSDWSECSRSCDGGAAYQLRSCLSASCTGPNIQYRACNTMPCPIDSVDFRSRQCQAYNDVPYQGRLYQWDSHYDSHDPCSLTCTAADQGFTVRLAPKVLDGTRCNRITNDMCINGQCRRIGCDGVLESGLVIDECGVCGGTGTTCTGADQQASAENTHHNTLFAWRIGQFSPCSTTCGVGVQREHITCRDIRSDRVVHSQYCEESTRPQPETIHCTRPSCQPVWIAGEWRPCTATCGPGLSRRAIYCVREIEDGSFQRTDNSACTDVRPHDTEYCNEFPCPQWAAGDWTPCSVTCGIGVQQREVTCRQITHDCSLQTKPVSIKPCYTDTTCETNTGSREQVGPPLKPLPGESPTSAKHKIMFVDNRKSSEFNPAKPLPGKELPERLYFRKADELELQPHITDRSVEYSREVSVADEYGGDGEGSGVDNDGNPRADYMLAGPVPFTGDDSRGRVLSSVPSFVTSSWSGCSTTCGVGLKNRRVQCKVWLELAETVQDLPDTECHGPKPAETEICKLDPCHDVSLLGDSDSYIWRFTGYGECSVSCLGGLQVAQFFCGRVSDLSTIAVEEAYCQTIHVPDKQPRPCNSEPCPPQWEASPASQCSAVCGGGFLIQRTLCVQRYGKEPTDSRPVPAAHCPADQQPPRKVVCNTRPCPPSWTPQAWSECSASCGKATQTRLVICQQKVGPGELVSQPDKECKGPKPKTQRNCDLPRCPSRASMEYIVSDNSWLVQIREVKKLFLDIGGRATLLPRTTVKIKCPVRKINRKAIIWKYEDKFIPHAGRIKCSRKGVLLIRRSIVTDSGVYTCIAGNATDNITIDFHSIEDASTKLSERAYMINRLNEVNFYAEAKITDSKASLLAIEREYEHFLPFHYVTSDWSQCTKSCGGAGLQSRNITCDLVLPHFYFVVRDEACTNRGQEKQVDTKDCGYEKCPHWDKTQWSQCSDQFCVATKYGSMKRSLVCVANNDTLVPLTYCDASTRPNDTLVCPHESCHAVWQPSSWSKCSKTCGGRGIKTRSIRCVWATTRKPAGANCRHQPRPIVQKHCTSPQTCNSGPCRDKSKYCSLIPRLNLCRLHQYHEDCCKSCSKQEQAAEKRRKRRPRLHRQ